MTEKQPTGVTFVEKRCMSLVHAPSPLQIEVGLQGKDAKKH